MFKISNIMYMGSSIYATVDFTNRKHTVRGCLRPRTPVSYCKTQVMRQQTRVLRKEEKDKMPDPTFPLRPTSVPWELPAGSHPAALRRPALRLRSPPSARVPGLHSARRVAAGWPRDPSSPPSSPPPPPGRRGLWRGCQPRGDDTAPRGSERLCWGQPFSAWTPRLLCKEKTLAYFNNMLYRVLRSENQHQNPHLFRDHLHGILWKM